MFETELEALNAVFDTLLNLPSTLIATGVSLAGIVLYPFVLIYDMLAGWWAYLWGILLQLIVALTRIQTAVVDFVNVTFVGAIPSVWVALLVLMVMLNVGFRLYAFLKHVSIFGWSI